MEYTLLRFNTFVQCKRKHTTFASLACDIQYAVVFTQHFATDDKSQPCADLAGSPPNTHRAVEPETVGYILFRHTDAVIFYLDKHFVAAYFVHYDVESENISISSIAVLWYPIASAKAPRRLKLVPKLL